MGFSVAAAAAILFAGGLVCLSTFMGAVNTANDDLRDAKLGEDARLRERLDTSIAIINGSANGTAVFLNLTNSGSSVIHVMTLDVLVNGTLYTQNITTREVNGIAATNLWAPGQTLRLVIAAPASTPATVKLVADSGYAFVGTVT
jgi:flagellar protein FlaF